MPAVGPIEMVFVLLYDVVAIGILVLFLYSMVELGRRILGLGSRSDPGSRDPALDTLRSRLALSEIDEAEFRQRMKALEVD